MEHWKRLRAAIGNALIWGAAWAAGSVVLLVLMALLGRLTVFPDFEEMFQVATWFGSVGVLAGAAFSGVLRLVARDRGVLDLNAAPFVIGGSAIASLFAGLLVGPVWIASVLGAATAGGTLALAKSAARRELAAASTPKAS